MGTREKLALSAAVDLIEQLIASGWIESGLAGKRVREVNYDPLVQDEMRAWCFFCCAEEEWLKGSNTFTNHTESCPWVQAMRLLEHPLPKGHNATIVCPEVGCTCGGEIHDA